MSKFRLYHYTTLENLHKILEARQINTIVKMNGTSIDPLVWLSCEKKYDCAINHNGIHIGEARIEIKTETAFIIKWNKVKIQERIRPAIAEYVDKIGISKNGNPHDWYTSNRPLYSGTWLRIEIFKDGKWILFNNPNQRKLSASEIAEERNKANEKRYSRERTQRYGIRQWI